MLRWGGIARWWVLIIVMDMTNRRWVAIEESTGVILRDATIDEVRRYESSNAPIRAKHFGSRAFDAPIYVGSGAWIDEWSGGYLEITSR